MSLPDLIRFVIENIVDKPEQVAIEEKDKENAKIISVKVAPEDIGLVIGKEGKRIKSIRRLAGIIGTKMRKKIFIEIAR